MRHLLLCCVMASGACSSSDGDESPECEAGEVRNATGECEPVAGPDGGAGGCPQGEIENLEGICVPNLNTDDPAEGYIGYYGEDLGLFHPIDDGDGIYLDGGEFEVPPSSELTQCTYHLFAPDEDFALGRYEVRMNERSHHFNFYRLDPVEVEGIEMGVPTDCTHGGIPMYIAGSEWPYVDAPMPEGFGLRIPTGVAVVMENHYINTSEEPITGHVEINLHGRDEGSVEHWVGINFNVMVGFSVPAGEERAFSARCPAPQGASFMLLTSHMHRFGRRFTIGLVDDATGATEPLYESLDYAHPLIQQRAFDPLVIGAGQSFEWSCAYENFTDDVVEEGEMGNTNEMCIMVAFYYDDTGELPYCLRNGEEM